MEIPEINKDRLLHDLNAVSRIGLGEGGSVTRLVFSVHELRSRQLLVHLMNLAGLDVRVDAAGNVFGRLPAGRDAPAVLAGSHLDSVVQGGRYDGPVGSSAPSKRCGPSRKAACGCRFRWRASASWERNPAVSVCHPGQQPAGGRRHHG